jgi:Protein of unknown function (DUF1572)
MRTLITSISAEFHRYKNLAEATISQLDESQLNTAALGGGNSITVICWHVSGNLASRFTDFLTTDGEKPWRQRDEEFETRTVGHAELLEKWQHGWGALLGTLAELDDSHLTADVVIRGHTLKVHEALHRALAHLAYHVGQIVLLGRSLKGENWKYLSIPPGQSATYNLNPVLDKAPKA